MEISVYCVGSEILKHEMDKIGPSAWNSSWYKSISPALHNPLRIVILKSNMTKVFTAGGLITISLQTLITMQIFRKYGYLGETHEIETEDGYLLDVHRIPPKTPDPNLPPVLLMHGLMGSSENFILLGPKRSLAYMLSDKGYDIWMPNSRGNFHSRKHRTLDPDHNNTYWMFSWHEIGKYDLPACIDYILESTGKPDLIYAGHSQGTTVFFVMASERPEYQSKIRLSMSLAPSVFLEHTKHPILRAVSKYYRYWDRLVLQTNQHEFIPFVSNDAIRYMFKFLCSKPGRLQDLCSNLMFMLIGFAPEQLDKKIIPLVTATVPAGSSARQALHYAQEIVTGKFRQYDFGKRENRRRYNTTIPPDYNLNISTPIGLFYAENDMLNDVRDVTKLSKVLPNVVKMYEVPYKQFTHFDFIVAKDVKTLVYMEVFDLMKKYNYNLDINTDDTGDNYNNVKK
ncbi:unnamed protein product [Brassicogethes aeneus]|uniref:Partial AB-hydrolase lipase domain-containing protein n=1 Tax=Brassicogethes aeneus TaxID=1431903 RepID=A0A9P0FC86_BRAAE|nr:unnamed protein product [Brassicogethes aeneus]